MEAVGAQWGHRGGPVGSNGGDWVQGSQMEAGGVRLTHMRPIGGNVVAWTFDESYGKQWSPSESYGVPYCRMEPIGARCCPA
eukprot:2713406-Pyramimonas_sp.AAC.1